MKKIISLAVVGALSLALINPAFADIAREVGAVLSGAKRRPFPHSDWQALAREISAGIREGRGCESLCSVIEKCGRILVEHFPKMPDDANELPDDLLV